MSQETIRKLAVVMSLAVRKEMECGSARLLRIQHSLEKELAPFCALLEAAEPLAECQTVEMEGKECAAMQAVWKNNNLCDGCKLRAALSDIQKQ